jgi:hypothetical protein
VTEALPLLVQFTIYLIEPHTDGLNVEVNFPVETQRLSCISTKHHTQQAKLNLWQDGIFSVSLPTIKIITDYTIMDISGRVIAVLPAKGGTSRAGKEWKSQEYVIETHDQYPKKICFEVFGADKVSQFALHEGEEVNVYFDIESREWNGRWFTSLRAWKVERSISSATGNQVVHPSYNDAPDFPPPPVDVPF